METRLKGLYFDMNESNVVEIFGHASKGLPGLEIVGLGKFARAIKEKIIYISKMEGISPRLNKVVICIEKRNDQLELKADSVRWLEFPLLMLYWSLLDELPIKNLSDCISFGRVNIDGSIIINISDLNSRLINLTKYFDIDGDKLKLLVPNDENQEQEMKKFRTLNVTEIFSSKNRYINF